MVERSHSSSVSSVHSHGLFVESENNLNGNRQSTTPLIDAIPDSAYEPSAEATANEKEGKEATKDTFDTSISDWFIWEVLAIVASLLLLIAIIVVLSQFDGHPQPTWKYISLNSLISWLSTISKGCVLFAISEALGQLKWVWFTQKARSLPDLETFDRASRGFYGSAELIWSLRARHFAVLGSVAVILALAFDPFAQNLVHYYPNLVTDVSQIATVSSSFYYDEVGLSFQSNAAWYVDPIFKANVYSSLLNSDPKKPWSIPQYSCSTGNCTWDPISALELSASCTNITDQLKFSCHDGPEFIAKYGAPNCSVNLLGSNTSASFVPNSWDGSPISVAAVKPSQSLVYKNIHHYVTQMIAPDGLLLAGPFKPGVTPWQAMECALIPIVRSFRITVTNGTYREETLDTWTNGTTNSRGGYYLYPPWGPEMGMKHNQSFGLSVPTMKSMDGFFKSIFTGNAKLSPPNVEFNSYGGSYAGTDIIQAILYAKITGCTATTADKLRCVMENVAAAASKTFRDSVANGNGAGGNGTISGRANSSATYIAVHWQWIALPAVVWLLGLTTLVGTIWKSRRGSVPKWKNDLIPLLFLYKNGQDGGVPDSSLNVRLYKCDDKMVLDSNILKH